MLNARHIRGESCVHMSEQNGVRSLHLGNSMVQSAMRLAVPNQLELTYTRCMMGFLLFHPNPANILMIGLGGGSLAKFVYHRLHRTQTIVIEVNPEVVVTARNYFFVPPDDERLQVLIAEGSEYIANHPASTDVLMVDGFDDGCQVASLCTQDFYNHARAVLKRRKRFGPQVAGDCLGSVTSSSTRGGQKSSNADTNSSTVAPVCFATRTGSLT